MNAMFIIRNGLLLPAAVLIFCAKLMAQDSTASKLNISLRYFMFNNSIPYVLANTKTKVEGKFQPVKNMGLEIYLDSIAAGNLIGKISTNKKGDAQAIIPGSLKQQWDAGPSHQFLAVSVENKQFAETIGDIEITKAKLTVDTTIADSIKTITVKVFELKDNEWIPVKDVEIKIGIRRLDGSSLPVGKEATYTTDSTGQVTAEFTRANLPAEKGILTLVVNVEDNDKYGNLVLEEHLPWGVNIQQTNDLGKRTLWSTRFKTPIWLLFMAYSIMAAVWGVLIYLIIQFIKIRKLGRNVVLDI